MNLPMANSAGVLRINANRVVQTVKDDGTCCTCAPPAPCHGVVCSYMLNVVGDPPSPPNKVTVTFSGVSVCGATYTNLKSTTGDTLQVTIPSFTLAGSFVLCQMAGTPCIYEGHYAAPASLTWWGTYTDLLGTHERAGTGDYLRIRLTFLSNTTCRLTVQYESSAAQTTTNTARDGWEVYPQIWQAPATSVTQWDGRNTISFTGPATNCYPTNVQPEISPEWYNTSYGFSTGGTATSAPAGCHVHCGQYPQPNTCAYNCDDCCGDVTFVLSGMPAGYQTTYVAHRSSCNWNSLPGATAAAQLACTLVGGTNQWRATLTDSGHGGLGVVLRADLSECPPVGDASVWSVVSTTLPGGVTPTIESVTGTDCVEAGI